MIVKVVILLSIAVCVLGDGHATSEQKVVVRHKKIIKDDKKSDEYAWSYPSYEFSYKVDDPHTKDKKGQSETREGDEVKGEYWLIEPDGRKRTVTYYADKETGFKADVEYSEPLKHIKEEKKSYHIPHYPEVEHKNIYEDYKKEEKEDEEEKKIKKDHEEKKKAKKEHEEEKKSKKDYEEEKKIKKEYEEEKKVKKDYEEEKKIKKDYEEDKDEDSSIQLGEYEPLPYHAPVVHKIREHYYHPRYYKQHKKY